MVDDEEEPDDELDEELDDKLEDSRLTFLFVPGFAIVTIMTTATRGTLRKKITLVSQHDWLLLCCSWHFRCVGIWYVPPREVKFLLELIDETGNRD